MTLTELEKSILLEIAEEAGLDPNRYRIKFRFVYRPKPESKSVYLDMLNVGTDNRRLCVTFEQNKIFVHLTPGQSSIPALWNVVYSVDLYDPESIEKVARETNKILKNPETYFVCN